MERKQAGKVERKTVDVYVRLGTSAWSQSDAAARTLSFARYAAATVRLGWGGCQREVALSGDNNVRFVSPRVLDATPHPGL